ncbi:Transglycosylase associated protein [Pseudonocardia sp. Ae168_Ps1]|nr:Transglycosylase associated protein [Pseudonocardia sp. Ae168_Ps1]OLL77177.1 Transglycosylase associated protein [Pseudonocardia sp. Ae150A_Ps1]OLL88715.1 Transglycosylase associated protein [Pseudonocardia sp. Ae263_Ps1]OLL91265.1 Transglycosylase associated protein [Pseudonocardia sp. Ae356_Ps1]
MIGTGGRGAPPSGRIGESPDPGPGTPDRVRGCFRDADVTCDGYRQPRFDRRPVGHSVSRSAARPPRGPSGDGPEQGGNVMLWTILGWIVLGLVAGFIARAVVPGKDDIGILRTILLGIVGSFVGGALASIFTGFSSFSPSSWIGSIIGAIIVLVVYNQITGRKKIGR